jgi:hypothetical protein
MANYFVCPVCGSSQIVLDCRISTHQSKVGKVWITCRGTGIYTH